jgi:hypothetical protein
MSRLTDKFGGCTEFVAIKDSYPHKAGDRLTLDGDDESINPYFINHATNEAACTHISHIKPYIAEIKQFDLVNIKRSDGGWSDNPCHFIADTSSFPGHTHPIIVIESDGCISRSKEMRLHVPNTEVTAQIGGEDVQLTDAAIEIIMGCKS